MYLYENKKINLDDFVIKFIPQFGKNNKDKITIRNLLLHNSGLIEEYKGLDSKTTKDMIINFIFD